MNTQYYEHSPVKRYRSMKDGWRHFFSILDAPGPWPIIGFILTVQFVDLMADVLWLLLKAAWKAGQ